MDKQCRDSSLISMSLFQILLIALIQGITEWLPVSSSGHVLLASQMFGYQGQDELFINTCAHAGTLAAMLLYFRKEVMEAVYGGVEVVTSYSSKRKLSDKGNLAINIVVATPIVIIVGILYETLLPETVTLALRSVPVVASATIGFGLLLWWADSIGGTSNTIKSMTWRNAMLIGASQSLALVLPGASRSGVTMTACRLLGFGRIEAARFSILIGAPVLIASSLYSVILLFAGKESVVSVGMLEALLVAIMAFVSGYVSIALMLTLLKQIGFLPFVIYRIGLGIILLLMTPSLIWT